jgi:opine dehydrogenase
MKIAIIGGGNGGYAAAADLTNNGHEIYFWQRSKDSSKALIKNKNIILMQDQKGKKRIKIHRICNTISSAIRNSEIIIILLPAFTQNYLAKKIKPHIQNKQIILLPPGSFGSWIFMKEIKNKTVSYAESGTLPYLTRKKNINTVSITTRASKLPTGVYSSTNHKKIIQKLKNIYPSIVYCGDILSGALMNAGPIIHPPLIILNIGPLEHFNKWDIHNEGTQKSIQKVMFELDNERIIIRKKLGYKSPHYPIKDHYENKGKKWMYGNLAHDKLVSSKDWREAINIHSHRYVIEDIKEGLAFMNSIAEKLNIKVPITSSLLDITSTILGTNIKKSGRTLSNLGVNFSLNKLKKILSDKK